MSTRRPLLFPLMVASGLLACGPAVPPVEPGPAPSASAPPAATVSLPEPGVVRCGIDDQPVSVKRSSSLSAADRSFLGDRPAPSPAIAPMEPLPPATQGVAIPQALPSPALLVAIVGGVPRLGGAEAPGVLGMVGPANGEVCESLAALPDSGPLELEVELASSSAPLRVRSSRPQQSPFVRCLMERACQVKAGSSAASQRLTLPLSIKVEAPLPPPPLPPPAPVSRVEARPTKGKEQDPLHLFVLPQVLSVSRGCVAGVPPFAGHIRLRLDIRSSDQLMKNGFLGIPLLAPPPMPMRPPLFVAKVTAEGPVSPELRGFATCIISQMTRQPVTQFGVKPGVVRVELVASLP